MPMTTKKSISNMLENATTTVANTAELINSTETATAPEKAKKKENDSGITNISVRYNNKELERLKSFCAEVGIGYTTFIKMAVAHTIWEIDRDKTFVIDASGIHANVMRRLQ